jgi:hypothetical protein
MHSRTPRDREAERDRELERQRERERCWAANTGESPATSAAQFGQGHATGAARLGSKFIVYGGGNIDL